jgi:prepilin-type processing-associated H-X9-DG protein
MRSQQWQSRRRHRTARDGWSVLELAVVVFVIGDLLLLLLPRLESTREAARRNSCAQNIKQLGDGAIEHAAAHLSYPSGGWGFAWLGDPDRGFDRRQPGGWMYSLLPFIGHEDLWGLGAGIDYDKSPASKKTAFRDQVTYPIGVFYCPDRRPVKLYPYTSHRMPANLTALDVKQGVIKSDYAINVGSVGDSALNQLGPGPKSYAEGDRPDYKWNDSSMLNGVSFLRSEIKPHDVTDGLSKTYLIGDKYLDPRSYQTGLDGGDNETAMNGFDNDTNRTGGENYGPRRDQSGFVSAFIWGSAHPQGAHFVFCDGSVHLISYDIDPFTHARLCDRHDGDSIDESEWKASIRDVDFEAEK